MSVQTETRHAKWRILMQVKTRGWQREVDVRFCSAASLPKPWLISKDRTNDRYKQPDWLTTTSPSRVWEAELIPANIWWNLMDVNWCQLYVFKTWWGRVGKMIVTPSSMSITEAEFTHYFICSVVSNSFRLFVVIWWNVQFESFTEMWSWWFCEVSLLYIHFCWQTVYFFDVQSTYLQEALKRFAEFFVEPLFNKDYMADELDIVDRGYTVNHINYEWRV